MRQPGFVFIPGYHFFIPIKLTKFVYLMRVLGHIFVLLYLSIIGISVSYAQSSPNDTIRLGVINMKGVDYPMVFLNEYTITEKYLDANEKERLMKLRNDVYVVYPYALAASVVFKDINRHLEELPDRHSRKAYLKSIDKQLDRTFKEPLKNLSIDQGHVLIKLIDRQTGENCYEIIKELKGPFAAIAWQSVGIFFKNNLRREYDPEDRDKDIERITTDLETSYYYRFQLQQQQDLMKKIGKK